MVMCRTKKNNNNRLFISIARARIHTFILFEMVSHIIVRCTQAHTPGNEGGGSGEENRKSLSVLLSFIHCLAKRMQCDLVACNGSIYPFSMYFILI